MSELENYKIPAAITAGGLVAGVAAVGGAFGYYYRPCELREGCRDATSIIMDSSLDTDPIWQSFSIVSEDSTTTVYNVTHKQLNKATLTNVIAYYEDTLAQNKHILQSIQTRPKMKPTDITFTTKPSRSTYHYVLDAKDSNTTLDNIGVDGATTPPDPDSDTSVSIIRSPDPLGHPPIFNEQTDTLDTTTAEDILYTELCQAIINVKAPTHSNDIVQRLGQETLCNSYGEAMTYASRQDSYQAYQAGLKQVQANQPYIPYNGTAYSIHLNTLSASTYAQISDTLEAS